MTREQADAEDRTKKLTATTPTLKAPKAGPAKTPTSGAEAAASASAQAQRYAQELMQIPEMKEFGSVVKSSPVVELTEAETEYVVSVVKHIFNEHIVLQYEVKNTLPDTVLENVSVVASPSDEEDLEEVFIIQAEKLATNEPGKVYVAFKKVNGQTSLPVSTFSNVLKFTSKEIDPSTGEPEETGYDDEYEVSEFDLSGSDYVIPTYAGNFNHIWEQVGASGEEAEETLQLSSMKSIAGKRFYPCPLPSHSYISLPSFIFLAVILIMRQQRQPSSWPRFYPYNLSKEPMSPSTRARTLSSYWARQSTAAEWWPTFAWHTRQNPVLRQRLQSEARKRAWRLL